MSQHVSTSKAQTQIIYKYNCYYVTRLWKCFQIIFYLLVYTYCTLLKLDSSFMLLQFYFPSMYFFNPCLSLCCFWCKIPATQMSVFIRRDQWIKTVILFRIEDKLRKNILTKMFHRKIGHSLKSNLTERKVPCSCLNAG